MPTVWLAPSQLKEFRVSPPASIVFRCLVCRCLRACHIRVLLIRAAEHRRNSPSSGAAQMTASTSTGAASAASTTSEVGAESGPDTDLDGNGKVDLAKFLTPSSTHGPKDAACVALFGSGAALERATSFAAQAMDAQYTL